MAMAYRQRALSIFLLCLTACSSVLSEEPLYYKEYMRTMQAAIDATVAAGVPPDDVDRTDDSAGVRFECSELPASVLARKADNVHELTPADVQVVAALGDSLTAAMGAKASTIFTALTEYKGVSWSIGGDNDVSSVFTIPNFIQRYNPNVIGHSTGTGNKNPKFNVAVSGAKSKDMPSQAVNLVEKLNNDPDVNVDEDWKLVTLFIGGNDLCDYCNDRSQYSPQNYAQHVVDALDILKDGLPRTFVNVVHTLDVSVVAELDGPFCGIIHGFACPCSTNTDTKEAAKAYHTELEKVIASKGYDTDIFAVVVQPFTAGIEDVPRDDRNRPDKSFFSPDCFHFSQKAHKDAALSLWNNMLEPVGQKEIGWEHNPNPKCPTEEFPFFYTNKNSGQQFGSFGAAPPAGPANTDSGSGGNLLGILLGSGIGAYVVTMAVIVAVVGTVWYRKRQRQHDLPTRVSCDTEKITLLKS